MTTRRMRVSKEHYENLKRLSEYLNKVHWDCIHQHRGIVYDPGNDEPVKGCFGVFVTLCFQDELISIYENNYQIKLDKDTEADIREKGFYVHALEHWTDLFGFSYCRLRHYGAHTEPFGTGPWPIHPRIVVQKMLADTYYNSEEDLNGSDTAAV